MKLAAHTAAQPPDQVKQAAKELEGFFLKRLMTEAHSANMGDNPLDGGFAGDTFREMLDGALSDQMAKSGGIGLAKVIEKSMRQGALAASGKTSTSPEAPSSTASITQAAPRTSAYDEIAPAAGAHFLKPAPGRYTSGFGSRIDPINGETSTHPGLDIAATTGTPVHAAAAGTVVRAGAAGTYGNLVVIKHPDGLETRYAHLSAVDVREGDQVAAGTEVGKVGATGRVTGPHLHFEVRDHGKAVDPRPYLTPTDSTTDPSTKK